MQENNINIIMKKAIFSKEKSNYKNEKEIIEAFSNTIKQNKSLFEATNKVDLSNNNGFLLNFNIINDILDKYSKIEPLINSNDEVILTNNNLLYSKIYSNLGIVLSIFNGNTYVILELILLGILTHNTMLFSYDGYMLGTNGLLITLIQSVLEEKNIPNEMFQHSYEITPEEYFDNFKTINKTIVIGDGDFQNKYLKLSTTEVITTGYGNYDIYIEDLTHIEVINKILEQNQNINLYVKSDLDFNNEEATIVGDVEEVITLINYSGSNYAASIFTNDNESASLFLKKVNSNNVMLNSSPTLQQQLNIKQEDLLKEKEMFMPNIYKFDGNRIDIELK